MKVFENKKVTPKGLKPTTYAELLQVVLDVPPQGGFTTTEMRSRIKIQKALIKNAPEIQLEDADHEKLSNLVKDMKWGVNAQELVDMEEAVINAKDPNAKKPPLKKAK